MVTLGKEKLSHFNALTPIKMCHRAGHEAWDWAQSLPMNDNTWATVGRKYCKDLMNGTI